MKKTSFHKLLLTQAVLASTLFVASGAKANLQIVVPTAGPVATNGADNNTVQITKTGNVTSNNDNGVKIDSIGGTVLIDPNNIYGVNGIDAIQTTGAATAASGVLFTQANGILTVGTASGIDNKNTNVASTAVRIDAADATVNNAGMIVNQGTGSLATLVINGDNANIQNTGSIVNIDAVNAINIEAGGTNATINNKTGASIFNSSTATGPTLLVNDIGLTLTNAGSILQGAAFDTLLLNESFTSITNQSGGLINQTGGGAKAVIQVNGGGGNLTNEQNATIQATKTFTRGIDFTTDPYTGLLTNAGTISTLDSAALALGVNFTQVITNEATGNLTRNAAGEATVLTTAVVTLGGGFLNRGNITATGGGSAIDFFTNPSQVTLTQESGVINGNILLGVAGSTGGNDVFVMEGGTILGNVTAAGVNANLLQLNGGEIGGTVQLGGVGDTVNLAGTDIIGPLLGGAGDDEINVTGGNFQLLDGAGGTNTLNVQKSFIPNGPIAFMGNINVQNAGTVFRVNNPITDMNKDGIVIDANTTLELNSSIQGSGSISNNGLLDIISDSLIDLSTGPGSIVTNGAGVVNLRDNVLTLNSNTANAFDNNAGTTLRVGLNGLSGSNAVLSNGSLNVLSAQNDAVTLSADSFVQPVVNGFIPNGSRFDIITVAGGGTIDPVFTKIVQPASVFLSFSEQFNSGDTILSLIAHSNSFEIFSSTEVTPGIAQALDIIADNNGFGSPLLTDLIAQFQGLTSADAVELAMESLIPPFNYGLVAGSHLGMDIMFDSVTKRLGEKKARTVKPAGVQTAATGVNSGDYLINSGGVWGQVLGGYLNQSTRHDLAGYKAKGAGLALGGDWMPNDCTTFGLAASYTKVNVDDKNLNPKDQSIKSWQGTAYGWWEFMDGLYLDAMFGVSSNHYKTNRVINVNQLHTAAHGDFDGTQYGAQADLGWDFVDCSDYFLAPFLRLKYIHLDLDDYTETGAYGLHVENNNVQEFLGGVGFRVGSIYRCGSIQYVPEISAMIAYDFKNDGEQTFAGFTAGGPAFATNGIKPGRTIFDLGVGVNTYMSCNSILEVKYNLEVRSEFFGNSLYLQYNYLWS